MHGFHVRPFVDDDLDAAGRLLAERHARHRAAESLLPDVADFRSQVELAWRSDGASGSVATDGNETVGYLIGSRRDDQSGPFAWIDLAGHASRKPEVVRDLYANAAETWAGDGLTRHMVFVPALPDLVDPWFRLCFGASAAMAARETAPEPPVDADVVIRRSRPEDLEHASRLDRGLWLHLSRPPSFSGLATPDEEWFVDDWRDTWDETIYVHFVAERGDRIVGHTLLYHRPSGDLRVPPDSIDLGSAATDPEVRGSGVGLALTAHVVAWAHANGYPTMTTDWRMTNLLASRFWPRRGFRETFLRLYRSIP